MRKILKGIKRIGVLALSAVIAMGTVTAIMPAKEVYAGEYEEITTVDKLEIAPWKFSDGLIKTGDLEKVSANPIIDADSKQIGYHYVLRILDAYKWPGSEIEYDIYFDINLYSTDGKNNEYDGELSHDFNEAKATSGDDTVDGVNVKTNYISIAEKYRQKYTLELEMWLQDGDDVVSTSGPNCVPFILGTVWNGPGEANKVYSINKGYTNYPKTASNLEYHAIDGFYGIEQKTGADNRKYNYITGVGYSNDGRIKIGYHQTGGAGALEMRIGYRGYSIEYIGDTGVKESTLNPMFEVVPMVDEEKPEHPTKDPHKVDANDGYVIQKYILENVYDGEIYKKQPIPDDKAFVMLTDNTIINKGKEIKPSQIPLIQMDKNVVIKVLTIPSSQAVELNYHFNNEQIQKQPGHDDAEGKPNLVENYKQYKNTTETEDPTSNGSLKPGVVINGKDGKDYKLVGWFEDVAFTTPYNFNENMTAPRNIYAKWEVVVDPPKPDPDPEPKKDDGSNNDNPGSSTPTPSPTPTQIRVDFVSQVGIAPLPQIKNVGEKATDPGAPFDPATLQPGTVINGYRFEGWFLDPAYALPYDFDTVLTKSIILYAKWVRVSPKTGDTTIPPIYFILGTAALAGAGLLIYRRKVKN